MPGAGEVGMAPICVGDAPTSIYGVDLFPCNCDISTNNKGPKSKMLRQGTHHMGICLHPTSPTPLISMMVGSACPHPPHIPPPLKPSNMCICLYICGKCKLCPHQSPPQRGCWGPNLPVGLLPTKTTQGAQ